MNLNLSLLTKTSNVAIVANENLEGRPIITPSRHDNGQPKTDLQGNPLGTIRLEQKMSAITGSFLNSRNRVAFLTGNLEQLTNLVEANGLKEGSLLGGKIVWQESLKPMWTDQTPKINPSSGETISIDVFGKQYPVYMQQRYTEDMNETDSLINNVELAVRWLQLHNMFEMPNKTAAPIFSTTGENANVPAS